MSDYGSQRLWVFNRIICDHRGLIFDVAETMIRCFTHGEHKWKYDKNTIERDFDYMMRNKVSEGVYPIKHLATEFFKLICDDTITDDELALCNKHLSCMIVMRMPYIRNKSLDMISKHIYDNVFICGNISINDIIEHYGSVPILDTVQTCGGIQLCIPRKSYKRTIMEIVRRENHKVVLDMKPRDKCDTSVYHDCCVSFF